MTTKDQSKVLLLFLAILGCVAFPVYIFLAPPVLPFFYSENKAIAVWRNIQTWQFQWILWLLTLLLPMMTFNRIRLFLNSGAVTARLAMTLRILRPLSFLPLMALSVLLAGQAPFGLLSNIRFYVPVLVFSFIVWEIQEVMLRTPGMAEKSLRGHHLFWVFILATAFFAGLGIHFTNTIGPHVGDEGHYYTMAQSLKKYGTLDLEKILVEKAIESASGVHPGEETIQYIKSRWHFSPKAREGRWYSTHSFGLSLLLAPFEGETHYPRHIVLGVIAALGFIGMLALCGRVTGAGFYMMLIPCLLLGGSLVWAGYAARSLPEVLGASLLVWAFWAIASERIYPWRSLFVMAGVGTYLAWAHVRFLPLGLLAAGFYGLQMLSQKEAPKKAVRIMLFSVLFLAGLGLYFAVQSRMFDRGVAYQTEDVILSYPMGAWFSFSATRGLVHAMPVFLWLFSAQIVWFIQDRKSRHFIGMVLVLFAATVALSCTTLGWDNGSSLPGKKLVVVLPLFLPATIMILKRSTAAARWWFIFLGMISIGYLAAIVTNFEFVGRSFCVGPLILGQSAPGFLNLLDPHALLPLDSAIPDHAFATLWTLTALGGTFAVLMSTHSKQRLSVLLILLLGLDAILIHTMTHRDKSDAVISPGWVERYLSRLDLEQIMIPVPIPGKPLEFDNVLGRRWSVMSLTTRDLGERVKVEAHRKVISQPHVEINDWAGREYRWSTIITPFSPGKGSKVISLKGILSGSAKPILAVREGSRQILEQALPVGPEGEVEASFCFTCRGGYGDLYILMRLENGEGEFSGKSFFWSNGSRKLIEQSGLIPPPNLVYVDVP